MSAPIEIPVVRHYQKGRTCYTGHMSAEDSARLTFADSYPEDPDAGRLGYQRPPNEARASHLAPTFAMKRQGS